MPELLETIDLITNFYTYEGVVKALNKVSLVIPHGCTFGLVGESGCGKSVTVRSIMRIVQPPGRIEDGHILLFSDNGNREDAVDLLRQSEAYMQDLRGNRISMIFQEPNAALNPTMTIGEQVMESYLLHRKTELCTEILEELEKNGKTGFPFLRPLLKKSIQDPNSRAIKLFSRLPLIKHWQRPLYAAAKARAMGLLGQLGIANPEEIVERYPHNLSGGMKQRVVIAIALACDPELLIADEATSNLDVTIQAQILELLLRLKKERLSSILLITHDLGVVAETCDRVGVMYAGNLCEEADVEDLFNDPGHPYTKALLAAVPKLHQEESLQSIEGGVPNLVNPPTGCRFHPRCPSAMDVCSKELPRMVEVGSGHQVACCLYT